MSVAESKEISTKDPSAEKLAEDSLGAGRAEATGSTDIALIVLPYTTEY